MFVVHLKNVTKRKFIRKSVFENTTSKQLNYFT